MEARELAGPGSSGGSLRLAGSAAVPVMPASYSDLPLTPSRTSLGLKFLQNTSSAYYPVPLALKTLVTVLA
jgi:hypothetical protein